MAHIALNMDYLNTTPIYDSSFHFLFHYPSITPISPSHIYIYILQSEVESLEDSADHSRLATADAHFHVRFLSMMVKGGSWGP